MARVWGSAWVRSAGLASLVMIELGCSNSPAPSEAAVEKTATTASALSVPQEFTWSQSQGFSTVMWNYNSGYCYLTRVTGRFRGFGEMVRVTVSNGTWVLTGTSNQVDVAASARCVPWSNFPNFAGAGFGWDMWVGNQGDCANNGTCASQTIWGADSFCSLAGVTGRLMGTATHVGLSYAGDGDSADVTFPGPSWVEGSGPFPDVLSGWQPAIGAFAQCLNLRQNHNMFFTGQFEWFNGDPPLDMGSVNDRICAITGITGYFNGGGEFVEITDIGNEWVMFGGSQTGGNLQVLAQCLFLSQ